ncbi:MAG: hypothetical protein QNL90_09210, partial [Gammaproteobacteria bacterium]|nr:hypothetical protein [Gammaproteobacteria bacterium]MDX2460314.1 hypothetical protein [Gammaproteobacteria bacterium]
TVRRGDPPAGRRLESLRTCCPLPAPSVSLQTAGHDCREPHLRQSHYRRHWRRDLRQPIPDALDRYLLIVFRDQFLDADQHYRLTEVFGAPCVNAHARIEAELGSTVANGEWIR